MAAVPPAMSNTGILASAKYSSVSQMESRVIVAFIWLSTDAGLLTVGS